MRVANAYVNWLLKPQNCEKNFFAKKFLAKKSIVAKTAIFTRKLWP